MKDLSDYEQRGGRGYWYRKDRADRNPYILRDCDGCGEPCLVARNGLKVYRTSFCSVACLGRHQGALRGYQTGSAHHRWKGAEVSYSGLRKRIEATLGKASEHACTECGKPAEDWSYDGLDPAERVDGERGRYSPDPGHYVPRCSRCDKAYDGSLAGEDHPNAKLTWQQVDAIRQAQGVPQRELARQHGVAQSTIWAVLHGKAWSP